MTHVACRLTAKNRDQPWNPTLANRVWATFLVRVKILLNCITQLQCCRRKSLSFTALYPPPSRIQIVLSDIAGGGRNVSESK